MTAAHLDIAYATLADCHGADDVVVAVDVLRAFTTAAHLFDRGAREIWPVADVAAAFAVRRERPDVLLVGEDRGIMVDGFDAGNSPSELGGIDVAGRIVVQRTTGGTQGIVRSVRAAHLLATSFVTAAATARAIRARAVRRVTFVVTGVDDRRDGDEDRACADYLVALLRGAHPDPAPYLARVPASTAGRTFADPGRPELPEADLRLAMEVDRFRFALEVIRGPRDVLRARADDAEADA